MEQLFRSSQQPLFAGYNGRPIGARQNRGRITVRVATEDDSCCEPRSGSLRSSQPPTFAEQNGCPIGARQTETPGKLLLPRRLKGLQREVLMSQSQDSLHEKLLEKLQAVKSDEPETDWLRDLVEWLYQEMMEMEFTDHLGAGHYERTARRRYPW